MLLNLLFIRGTRKELLVQVFELSPRWLSPPPHLLCSREGIFSYITSTLDTPAHISWWPKPITALAINGFEHPPQWEPYTTACSTLPFDIQVDFDQTWNLVASDCYQTKHPTTNFLGKYNYAWHFPGLHSKYHKTVCKIQLKSYAVSF